MSDGAPDISGLGGGSGNFSVKYVEEAVAGATVLLKAAPSNGYSQIVKNVSAGSITVSGNGHDIESGTTVALISGEAVWFRYNGTKWLITALGENLTWLEQWVAPPASGSAPGVKGQMSFDGTYLYTCVDTDTWVRAVVATSWVNT